MSQLHGQLENASRSPRDFFREIKSEGFFRPKDLLLNIIWMSRGVIRECEEEVASLCCENVGDVVDDDDDDNDDDGDDVGDDDKKSKQ